MDGFALVIGYVTGVGLAVMNGDSPVARLVTKFSKSGHDLLGTLPRIDQRMS